MTPVEVKRAKVTGISSMYNNNCSPIDEPYLFIGQNVKFSRKFRNVLFFIVNRCTELSFFTMPNYSITVLTIINEVIQNFNYTNQCINL